MTRWQKYSLSLISLVGVLVCTNLGCIGSNDQHPLRIGVMLPLTGISDIGWRKPLEFALNNIHRAGGISHGPIELVYRDTAVEDINTVATQLIADPSILAVIGPETSRDTFLVAPQFIRAQKPLITPSATSADIFRAFGGKKYIWRTVESDIAQLQTLLLIAKRKGMQKVALLTSTDQYGTTFFDWFGFFATELGFSVTDIIRYDQSADSACDTYVAAALTGKPDGLLVVPSERTTAVCIIRSARTLAPQTQLLLSDVAYFPNLISELGQHAEGLEGTILAPDTSSGFEIAYRVILDEQPPAYAANIYDALLLIAYGLERSGGVGGKRLAEALEDVVDGRGAKASWDEDGIREAILALRVGDLPDITGASGILDFDQAKHTDLISSTYGHWRVEYGEFITVEFLSTGEAARSLSIANRFASERLIQNLEGEEGEYRPLPKEHLWALIMALSGGWNNYRHQADALAQYQLLKANGVPDEHIVLVLADDLAQNPANMESGVVRNVADGPNLYSNVKLDYRLQELQSRDVLDILAGAKSSRLPEVIASTAEDNIYVFLVGHGNTDGIIVNPSEEEDINPGRNSIISPAEFAQTFSSMFQARHYRRVLVVVEACHGGVMGQNLNAPGVILYAGANPFESSLAANYDPELGIWLADQFAYAASQFIAQSPQVMLNDFYRKLYFQVGGSHVSVYNNRRFGDINQISLEEFLKP